MSKVATPRKTKPRGPHPYKSLSPAFIRKAPPGRHADGNGLYLYVQPSGARSWVQRLVIRGRRRELGLGSTALVPLAEAREKAWSNRKLAREGGDPLAEKRRASAAPTFREAAARVVEQQRAGWRDPNYPRVWTKNLERYAFGRIGDALVGEVTGSDVFEVLEPIWHAKPPTARTVLRRMRAVFEWSVAMELRATNPCDRVERILGPQYDTVEHMRALPHCDVARALAKVRASDAAEVVKLGFEFLVLTVARWGEVRWAVWPEINLPQRVWTVPAGRMKARREHRVPLCSRALEILRQTRQLQRGTSYVFARSRGRALGDKQVRRMLVRNRIAAVPHGFRSSFRDWAAEETNYPREVVEAALAHTVRNKVEAAYRRTDLFERRRRLMDDWAAYLAKRRARRSYKKKGM